MQFRVFSTRAKAEDWAAEVHEDYDYVEEASWEYDEEGDYCTLDGFA